MISETQNDYYGFVTSEMNLLFESLAKDVQDLRLLIADLETIHILQSHGIGCDMTSFGITMNESKVLLIATRFAYCCSCGRFASEHHVALKGDLIKLGKALCPDWFDGSISEALRFARTEPDFMATQTSF